MCHLLVKKFNHILRLLFLGFLPALTVSANESDPTNTVLPVLTQEVIAELLDSMVKVEGGTFTMGTNEAGAALRETPAHQVTIDSFLIGKTEVTQKLFTEVMGWNVSYFQCDNCPVNNISWMNIQKFIVKLNTATGMTFRLPTEAEWAFAAKGGNLSNGYKYSGSDNINDVAWYADNADGKSHPVALKSPNELGLYDMTGNLWEFCHDDMKTDLYREQARINPVFDLGFPVRMKSLKVMRGSGYDFAANESQVYRRDGATSNVRMPDIGFRLAMDSQ